MANGTLLDQLNKIAGDAGHDVSTKGRTTAGKNQYSNLLGQEASGFGNAYINDLIDTPRGAIRRKKFGLGVSPGAKKDVMFPHDLSSHAMVFHFKRSNWMEHNTRQGRPRIIDTVALPVPANVVDSINAEYNELELGAVGGALSDVQSIGEVLNTAEGAVDEAFNMGKLVAEGRGEFRNKQGIATLALRDFARSAGASAGFEAATRAGLSRFFGNVPNPTITALFKGVGLRNHSFNWRLSPQNVQESYTLKHLINKFKRSMLPNRTNSNLTLDFPDDVDIYIRGQVNGLEMFKFKTAVIKNVTTNYAPDNIPSFFAGTGAPTHVDFRVDLLETSIHTREDYEYEHDYSNESLLGGNAPVGPFSTAEQEQNTISDARIDQIMGFE